MQENATGDKNLINVIVAFPKIENAKSIKNILVRSGFHVDAAVTTGAQALQYANSLDGGNQPHLGRGRRLPHGLPDGAGGGEHGFAAHIQPDLAVGVGRSGPEHAPEKFLAGERLAGALAVEAHVLLTEAPAPDQRRVVVQAEVVLHPQDGGLQLRIARIEACDVPLPLLAQGADAQRRLVTLHIHHGAEVQRGVHALAKVRVEEIQK